jgi:hypothetical protein
VILHEKPREYGFKLFFKLYIFFIYKYIEIIFFFIFNMKILKKFKNIIFFFHNTLHPQKQTGLKTSLNFEA